MAKKPNKRTQGDVNAERRGVPGRDRQVPAKDFTVSLGGKPISRTSMNFRGLMGGNPTTDAGTLRSVAKYAKESGATDSAKAAKARATNVEGHDAMTRRAKATVKEERTMASARAREAAAEKRRNERPKYAKGGKIDGCAKRGHTKGKMR